MDMRGNVAQQRRTYAMSRLQRAMARLVHADDACESILAKRWVNAWSGAIGEAHFDRAARTIFSARRANARNGSHG
jgi:hypothetical protein